MSWLVLLFYHLGWTSETLIESKTLLNLTLLHSEWPELYGVLAILSAKELTKKAVDRELTQHKAGCFCRCLISVYFFGFIKTAEIEITEYFNIYM